MENIIQILQKRDFIQDMTTHQLGEWLQSPKVLYSGFDPTADSLHLGNLVALVALGWFKRQGHTPIVIVGGATGMVGDPSGKSVERNLLDEETLAKNLLGIRKSIFHVLGDEVQVLNNYDWMRDFTYLGFLRDIGKNFRMGTLLAKESVRSRLASEEGLSYTEFSYQLLQAYDFYYLAKHHQVSLQIGGSDQWGNIVAGTELIKKLGAGVAHGMTLPLLTKSDGKKFGKSEEGTIWLNEDKLSVYDFYQYLFRVADQDVIRLLKMVTYLPIEQIQAVEVEMKKSAYVANSAQRLLAQEVTRLVHGNEALTRAEAITRAASPGAKTTLDASTLNALAGEIPSREIPRADLLGIKMIDLLLCSELLNSKGEARRLIQNGGAYLNNEKLADPDEKVKSEHLIDNKYLLLSVGKKKKVVIRAL